eukprot:8452539-Lingulodinium_polyedra.AAC.1
MAAAWQAFHKYSEILCNKAASMRKRLKMLTLLVHNSLFWCSGSWNLDNKQLDNLRGLHRKMLRRMIGIKRPAEMTVEDYMIKTNGSINNIMNRHGIVNLDVVALRNHFGWAGHVSRLSSEFPDRLVGKVLKWRDSEWLNTIEEQNNGRQLHCRILRTWRWERPLVRYSTSVGAGSWHDLAVDRRKWVSNLDNMASWFRTHRS